LQKKIWAPNILKNTSCPAGGECHISRNVVAYSWKTQSKVTPETSLEKERQIENGGMNRG